MPERSGFATTTFGTTYWGERIGAKLAARRLARQPRTDLADVTKGIVHVRGTVRAIEPTVIAPLSERACVFGRVLSCFETRHPEKYGKPAGRLTSIALADHTFGGGFAIDDASGRGRVVITAEDPFELFVDIVRVGAWNRAARSPAITRFEELHGVDLGVQRDDVVLGEWAIALGDELSIIASVVDRDAAPDELDYRAVRHTPVFGPRGERPIILFA